jgi:hypothetical protein
MPRLTNEKLPTAKEVLEKFAAILQNDNDRMEEKIKKLNKTIRHLKETIRRVSKAATVHEVRQILEHRKKKK